MDKLEGWHIVNIPCSRDGRNAWTIPGSFLLPWNGKAIAELPDEVLEWEFTNLIQQHRNQGNL